LFTQKLAAHILTDRDTSAAGKSISGPAIAKHYAAIIDSREHGHEWVAVTGRGGSRLAQKFPAPQRCLKSLLGTSQSEPC
jgi:hypothetical protein